MNEERCGQCYSNGSGCGNEFRSESPMGRKFVIDSLKYWVTEYKIDGFRFDLVCRFLGSLMSKALCLRQPFFVASSPAFEFWKPVGVNLYIVQMLDVGSCVSNGTNKCARVSGDSMAHSW